MILGPTGENVYPDELEELYRDSQVRQGAVGRRPAAATAGHETVAALIVPDYEHEDGASIARRCARPCAST